MSNCSQLSQSPSTQTVRSQNKNTIKKNKNKTAHLTLKTRFTSENINTSDNRALFKCIKDMWQSFIVCMI